MMVRRAFNIMVWIVAIAGLIVGILLLLIPNKILPMMVMGVDAQQMIESCPDGSYSIGTNKNGDHICKLEPTGCPYGDSIPLGPDCDKHAPVESTVEYVAPAPVEYIGGGK